MILHNIKNALPGTSDQLEEFVEEIYSNQGLNIVKVNIQCAFFPRTIIRVQSEKVFAGQTANMEGLIFILLIAIISTLS